MCLPSGRRATAIGAGIGIALGAHARPVAAVEEPKITARCAFDIKIGNEKNSPMRRLVIGVFGEEAPILSRTFIQACTASYPGPAGVKAAYKLSEVKTVVKDKYIKWADFKDGNLLETSVQTDDKRWVGTRIELKSLAGEDTLTDEVNNLRHNVAGRVSMRRGGGTFDFSVAPVPDATWLDETNVVIGQVLEGMDLISDINSIKMYGPKPLRKIKVFKSRLLSDEASKSG